jgi:hypothetical protein
MVTSGVAALDRMDSVLRSVRGFSKFNADNDPYNEHDFGSFVIDGHQLIWKFDYFDCDMQMASLDAAEEAITLRVLTIMLADEY